MASPQRSLALARQGDPTAIAFLINHALQSRGVSARVTRTDTLLKVMLEADQVPDQQMLVPYLQKNLVHLKIASIQAIEVYGKQTCAASPAWRQTINLEHQTTASKISESEPPESERPESPESTPVPVAPVPQTVNAAPPVRPKPATSRPVTASTSKSQKIYQAVFAGVTAMIFILIGANLRSAQTLLTKPPPTSKNVTLSDTKDGVYQARIINRIGGVPVIMVTFNGSYNSPMIVDTGASSTVITQTTANSLQVEPVGQTVAQTANGYTSFDVGYVESIEVEGAKVNKVPVAIAPPNMDIGLLGHDFFDGFDVTVREEVVEFRPR